MAEMLGSHEPLDPNWITGFVDGEGCFSLYAYHRSRKSKSPNATAEFSIQLREDDKEVLLGFQRFFGCGTVAACSRQKMRDEGHPNARDQVSFKVRKIDDLVAKVIPHFDQYLPRSKKLTDYLIWREGVMILEARYLWYRTRRNTKEARKIMLAKFLELSSDLREGRNPGLRRSPHDMVA